jgi:hypothetical protein
LPILVPHSHEVAEVDDTTFNRISRLELD